MTEPGDVNQDLESGLAIGGDNTGEVNVTTKNTITARLGFREALVLGGALVVVALIFLLGTLLRNDPGADEVGGISRTAPVAPALPTPTPAPPATAVPEPIEESPFDDRRLSGVFNIAVLEFESSDVAGALEAEDAGIQLVEFLRGEVGSSSTLGDIDVGFYERGADVADLGEVAQLRNANMVVTATLSVDDQDRSVFSPIFFIAPGTLDRTEELAGHHALGSKRRFAGSFGSPSVKRDLRQEVQARSEDLIHLITGLSAHREQSYDFAIESFAAVVSSPDCFGQDNGRPPRDAGVQSLAYGFLGQSVLLRVDADAVDDDDFDQAERCFDLALDLTPGSPRPQFGRAAIAFQRVRDRCEGNGAGSTDLDDVRAVQTQYQLAFDDYRQAVADSTVAPIPYLATAARLGLGRIALCLSIAGDSAWDVALREFDAVTTRYLDEGDAAQRRRLASFASEAYAGIGLVAVHRPSPASLRAQVASERAAEVLAADYERLSELRGPDVLAVAADELASAEAALRGDLAELTEDQFAAAIERSDRANSQWDALLDDEYRTLRDTADAARIEWEEARASMASADVAIALAAFEQAASLVEDPERKALFLALVSEANYRAGDFEAQADRCKEARSLDPDLNCFDASRRYFLFPPDEVLGLAITGSPSASLAVVAAGMILLGVGLTTGSAALRRRSV